MLPVRNDEARGREGWRVQGFKSSRVKRGEGISGLRFQRGDALQGVNSLATVVRPAGEKKREDRIRGLKSPATNDCPPGENIRGVQGLKGSRRIKDRGDFRFEISELRIA